MPLVAHWEGEPTSLWGGRWAVPVLEIHDQLGSTNDRARELVVGGARLPVVVIAESQSAGRGRHGARWDSPRGMGLWISMALGTDASGDDAFPLRVGLAAARACEEAAPGLQVGIKWPNDLFIGDRKVGGVLCERVSGAVVAGVGLNVRQRPQDFPTELAHTATSLEAASREGVSRAGLATALVRRLCRLDRDAAGALDPSLLAELATRDVLCGRSVWTRQAGEGTARGIAADGALLLEDHRGAVVRVVAGSVRTL